MAIRDRNVDALRKRIYLDACHCGGVWAAVAEAAGTGSAQNMAHNMGITPQIVIASQTEQDTSASDIAFGTHTAANAVITQPDAAQKAAVWTAVVPTEIGTTGQFGMRIQTASDLFPFRSRVPSDIDPNFSLGFRVNWCSASSTTTDTIDWIVKLDFKAEGAAIAAAATALDTALAQDTVTGALHNQWTSRGVKNNGFLTRAQIEAGAQMVMTVELDATDATLSSEATYILGLEIDYVSRSTRGGGHDHDRPLVS